MELTCGRAGRAFPIHISKDGSLVSTSPLRNPYNTTLYLLYLSPICQQALSFHHGSLQSTPEAPQKQQIWRVS
jgi:hypothetical protein